MVPVVVNSVPPLQGLDCMGRGTERHSFVPPQHAASPCYVVPSLASVSWTTYECPIPSFIHRRLLKPTSSDLPTERGRRSRRVTVIQTPAGSRVGSRCQWLLLAGAEQPLPVPANRQSCWLPVALSPIALGFPARCSGLLALAAAVPLVLPSQGGPALCRLSWALGGTR